MSTAAENKKLTAVLEVSQGKTKGGIFWRLTKSATSKDFLVMIMGYGGSLRIWPASFVDELARDYQVLTYDNRGTGLSIVPSEIQSYSIAAMAEDLHEVVVEVGIPKFHLLGYSMGGCIALQYARRHPEYVKTLFLHSTTAGGKLYAKPAGEISGALASPQGNTLWDVYLSTFKLMYSPAAFEALLPAFRELYDNSKEVPTSALALRGHSHAFREFDASSYVHELTMPALILAGACDRLMPPENSENLAKALPLSRLVMLDDCEHGAHLQMQERVIAEIRQHCRGASN